MTLEARVARWSDDQLIAVPLMCVSFAVAGIVGFHLFEARATVQLDVWFHTDPDDFLVHRFMDLFRHPNIGLFLGVPLRAVTRMLGLLGNERLETQYWLMLLVAPVSAAIRTGAAYHALRSLTGSVLLPLQLCLLDIAAFATIALGSVPESFALSAASIAALYCLLATDARGERVRWVLWLGVGTFAAGVTLSNLAPFAILFGGVLFARREPLLRTVASTAAAVLAVGTLTAVLATATSVVTGQPLRERIDSSTGSFVHPTPSSAVASELVAAMSHTFIAPRALPSPGYEPPSINPDYDFQLLLPASLQDSGVGLWRGLLTALVLGLGTAGYLCQRTTMPWLLPAAAILVVNFVLHLFYGHHYFLYSLHWSFSMVWVMAGVAFLPERMRRAAIGLLWLFLAITTVNSVVVTHQLLAFLRVA